MYSFDVFDTLITRTTATPRGIFALIKDRLEREREENGLPEYIIDNFYELRVHSEELARKSGLCQQKEEVTLPDIYEAMAVCGCLDGGQQEYLRRLEESVEIANVIGICPNIQRVKKLLEQGEKVVLVSDMYLSKEAIRKMLLRADDIFRDIPLYVSSEYGVRKTTGRLYQAVRDIENVRYEEWTHIGDNMYQDIDMPCRLGIRAELVKHKEISEFEKNMIKNHEQDGRMELMVGTAVRAEGQKDTSDAYHIGCRYAGPILYGYADWIVTQAVKKKIKRLYFIARDGYLVKKAVDVILEKKKLEMETGYIYGSRKAWRMPSLSAEHYNLYQLIVWSHAYKITTLGNLAEVLHVSLDELYGYLPGTFAKNRNGEEESISNQELEYIIAFLSVKEDFKGFHLKSLEQERKLVKSYLFQEIDTSDDDFAFVDVAGGGLTQGCLYELMKEDYGKPIHTFFFKIDRVNLVKNSRTYTFMPCYLENNLVIEMICRAPHGQTLGYAMEGKKVVPVLEERERASIIKHDFDGYERGILNFTELMCDISWDRRMEMIPMKNILPYMKHIAEEPSKKVLEYFASMPNGETGREKEVTEYAPRLTQKEMEEIFLFCTYEPMGRFYKGCNIKYSIMRATQEERDLIEKYKKEHDAALGRLCRQEKERAQKEQQQRYGRAAFYPVRLLEEKLVLYGAGKFGQDLYKKLTEDTEHEVVLWVDKNAAAYQKQGMENVQEVSRLEEAVYDQIVIAVMKENLADTIRQELCRRGMDYEKIIWLKPYPYPDCIAEWKVKGIG